ncbi:linear amide C-N hydrolase [Roseibium sp.]|uniref:linear amide C-N hydrolase n=1 Tax=Roseibium sp. TaxID=1936156 RepID=UPI003BAFB7BE
MDVPVRRLKQRVRALAVFCLAIAVPVTQGMACSTVAFPAQTTPLLSYNFDFAETGAGYLILNPAEIRRQSVLEAAPAKWVARFGSLTVNQIGPGMPTAGMNSAGLVVTLMWNEAAVYGGPQAAPALSELEFIQYLLDTSGSVEEALASLDRIRIKGLVPIHYFLFDGTGEAAVVTPTADGLSVNTGAGLPVPALTNSGYDVSFAHLDQYRGFGGDMPIPERQRSGEDNSLDRFAIAANAIRYARKGITSAEAFGVLNRLANPETRWQLVFEPQAQVISLRVPQMAKTYVFDLAGQDLACRGQPVAADLRDLPADLNLENLQPLDPDQLAGSLEEVFTSMRQTAHLGQREIAGGIAAGLIAAASCMPE